MAGLVKIFARHSCFAHTPEQRMQNTAADIVAPLSGFTGGSVENTVGSAEVNSIYTHIINLLDLLIRSLKYGTVIERINFLFDMEAENSHGVGRASPDPYF